MRARPDRRSRAAVVLPTAIAPAGPVKPLNSEDDYNSARGEYDAIPLHATERPARREALQAWLMKQLSEGVDRGHLEEAYEQLKQAATLWDPEELSGKVHDERAPRRRRCASSAPSASAARTRR